MGLLLATFALADSFRMARLAVLCVLRSDSPKPVEPKLLRSVDPIDARRGIRNPDKLSAQTAQTFAPRLQNRGIAPSNSTR